MRLTHVAVKVGNFRSEDSFTAQFLVDTKAWNSFAPASELRRIGIEPTGKDVFELVNGQVEECQYAYVKMAFMEEITATRIIFGPDDIQPLLGVLALQSAGFLVDPQNKTVRKMLVFPLKTLTSAKIAIAS